jgi:hypothetical protein
MYLNSAPTIHNRPQRNFDGSKGGENTIQPRLNHNDIDLLLYYFQFGQLPTTADVSHFNSR